MARVIVLRIQLDVEDSMEDWQRAARIKDEIVNLAEHELDYHTVNSVVTSTIE